jgi:hypothetical protein
MWDDLLTGFSKQNLSLACEVEHVSRNEVRNHHTDFGVESKISQGVIQAIARILRIDENTALRIAVAKHSEKTGHPTTNVRVHIFVEL